MLTLAAVIPMGIVSVTVYNLLRGGVESRAFDQLGQSGAFARSVLADRSHDVARVVAARAGPDLARQAAEAGGAVLTSRLEEWMATEDLDVAVVSDAAGTVVAASRRTPRFATGADPPTDGEMVAGMWGDKAIAARAQVPSTGGHLVGGIWLDSHRLERIFRPDGVGLVLVGDGGVLASTLTADVALADVPASGRFTTTAAGRLWFGVSTQVPGEPVRIVALAHPPLGSAQTKIVWLIVVFFAVLMVLIAIVGYLVSGVITRPMNELAIAAVAVSQGDLDQRVAVKGDAETAAVGRAFNQMTENLRDYVHQLEQTRTEFRQALARLGDVLASADDLSRIVEVVLETCALTLRGEAALFYERVAMPARLRAAAAYGRAETGAELNGVGVAGSAALELKPVMFPGQTALAPGEPQASTAVAVPMSVEGRLFGVLAVYGRADGGAFTDEDLATLQTLSYQAEVAIGNVMLHEETRRQARTDDLTGLWNRREFELRCREAVKEAGRFNEPFGLMLVDIDDFKLVNDRFSYLHGNAALIALAARLSEATREVDFVARWGGEEFVVLVPRAGPEETALVCERVRMAVESEPVVHDGSIIPLTVSIGYAGFPEDGTSAEELFSAANAALKRAKHLGKNRVRQARADEGVA